MSDKYFALKGVSVTVTDDGARTQIALDRHEAETARFYVSPEGLGSLMTALKTAALAVTERLVASGLVQKYNLGEFEAEASEVISAQVALDGGFLSLAFQGADGTLVRVRLAAEAARMLQSGLSDCLPEVAPTEPSAKVQ